jgi:hypothetical protein
MRHLGLEPDTWQAEVLKGCHHRLFLNCRRQAGKSTVVAVLSLLGALWVPATLVLLLSRSHRQSTERSSAVVTADRTTIGSTGDWSGRSNRRIAPPPEAISVLLSGVNQAVPPSAVPSNLRVGTS